VTQTIARDTWDLSRRIEAWAGEIRVNLIRIVAMLLFYGRHVVELLVTHNPDIAGLYHLRVTAVIIAWAGAAGVIHLLLVRRIYPPPMKFATAALDVLMITLLCAIAGGPKTELVILYFAAIASAPLRLSLPVVWMMTAGCILGYLVLLAYYAWFLIGFHNYYAYESNRIPRSQEVIMILALLVTGLFAGQVVRQVRRMIERYPQLHGAEEGAAA
jgi:hypothetical protein